MSEEKPDIQVGDEIFIERRRWRGMVGIVHQEIHYNPRTEKWCIVFKDKYADDGILYMTRVEDVRKLNK